jgi:hypothetical protein
VSPAIQAGIDWAAFSYSLAHVLRRLRPDSTFSLEMNDGDEHDAARYMQFCAYGPGMLRCEVVSNDFLPPERKHSIVDLRWLADAGWGEPGDTDGRGSPNHYLDVAIEWVDFAADLAVRVFRDLWGVTELTEIVADLDDLRRFRWLAVPDKLR